MEQTKNELQLVSNMIMCGDHPSITKTELNAKPHDDDKQKEKDKDKEKDVRKFISYGRISPTSSRTHAHGQARTVSEQALRALGARRRAHSLDLAELLPRDLDAPANTALVQAALGGLRWPPYLLLAWLLVLLLTHALHALLAALERALPALRKACHYFRTWTEARWRAGGAGGACAGGRAGAAALAAATAALYALRAACAVLHAAALWAVEPLGGDPDPDPPTVVNYDEIPSKVNLNAKQ